MAAEVFYFTDLNHPGVVYRGTEAHSIGLDREGGYAHRSKVEREVQDNKMLFKIQEEGVVKEEWWDIVDAPEHWAISNEEYDRLNPRHTW